MSATALKKIVSSSKASVLLVLVVALAALVYVGKLDAQQFLDALKVLVPSWMLAHAGETGAKALAERKATEAPSEADADSPVNAD